MVTENQGEWWKGRIHVEGREGETPSAAGTFPANFVRPVPADAAAPAAAT